MHRCVIARSLCERTLNSLSVWKGLQGQGPFTQRASDEAAMHAFLDAMKRRDRVFTLHAIKPLFPHCQIYICVETCPMRAITVAMDLARVVTRQCEYIIKIYSALIFPLVALLHRSLARSLCERTFMLIFAKWFHVFHERSYANRAIIGYTT